MRARPLALLLVVLGCESRATPPPSTAAALSVPDAPMAGEPLRETPSSAEASGPDEARRVPEAPDAEGPPGRDPPRACLGAPARAATDEGAQGGLTVAGEPKKDAATTSGRLQPEQIQSVIRSHYGVFRKCYEAGLARNPRLHGKVATRFVIDREGRVAHAHIAENELPDCLVTACVRDEFKKFTFPKPEGGIVTVVYPIMLEPD